jgi:hypothetical protein
MAEQGSGESGPGGNHLDEARRLIAACGADTNDAASIADTVEKICRHVIDHLDPLIGRRAAQALFSRAVYLSKRRVEILKDVSTVEPDADVARELPDCLRSAPAEEALQAALDVLGNFVWLLTHFISNGFGLRLLREACPDPDEEHS